MKVKDGAFITVDDFWHDLFRGGYVKPENILENQDDIDAVKNAISVLKDFEISVKNITEII